VAVALVLSEDAGAGPFTFPGFPGVWSPGVPIEASVFVDAGSFASEADLLAAAEALPLEQVTVAKGAAPLPPRGNHVASPDEQAAALEIALSEMTHAELDAKAATLGIDLPDVTKAEKVEALEAALTPEQTDELADELVEAEA
jgi:hypothetical protein